MAFVEFPDRIEGEKPGLYIDEGYSETFKTSYLDCRVYNSEGDLVFYTDFDRNESLKEIKKCVLDAADILSGDPPPEMVEEEAERLSEYIRKEALRAFRRRRK